VVAIIAILALIAVPNFLEAQMRAKVSRAYADIRSQRVALEAYRVDSEAYPGSWNLPRWPRLSELTTPIAYITSCPFDPFNLLNGQPAHYHYVSATDELDWLIHNWRTYTYGWNDTSKSFPAQVRWHIRSHGPNMQLDHGIAYDPTNGTVSVGDICVWGP
jgi:type II secretory pathway pseudopilin PulG